MKYRIIIAFLFLICLCGCSGSSGGGGGRGVGNVSGTVFDLDFQPVSNADVVSGSNSTRTLSNGNYSLVNIPAGEKFIKISASSQTPSYRKVVISGGQSVNAGISITSILDSKVTPIKNTGGVATSTNGSVKMVFPNGAFSTTTQVVLTSVPKIAAPLNPPEGKQFISYIVYAKPDTATLLIAAKLMVPNLTGVTIEPVDFYRFDTDYYEWKPIGIGHASAETNTINIDTINMGWLAATMPINPAPGTIEGIIKDSSSLSPIAGANVWTISSYGVSDSTGHYVLSQVPTGLNTVYAAALGYSTKSGDVTVVSMQSRTLDLQLDPQDQGNVSGIVRGLYSGYLYQARVADMTHGRETYTDSYGRYTLFNTPSGPAVIAAFANGYISSSETVNVPPGGATVTQDFRLSPTGTINTYTYDFESGEQGFTTHTGFWHRHDATEAQTNYFNSSHGPITRKTFLPDSGIIPSANSGNHYFWYGQASPPTVEASYIGVQYSGDTEEGSGGNSFTSNCGTLESPVIDLSGYSYGNLSFWTWWEIEGQNPATGYDMMLIYIKKITDTNWTLLGALNPWEDPSKSILISGESYTSGGFNQPGIWVKHNFDISSFAGSQIQIRFFFDTVDQLHNGFRGWFIDDISISNSQFGTLSTNVRPFILTKPRN